MVNFKPTKLKVILSILVIILFLVKENLFYYINYGELKIRGLWWIYYLIKHFVYALIFYIVYSSFQKPITKKNIKAKDDSFGVLGFIFSILSIITFPLMGPSSGIFLSILGLVFSRMQLKKNKTKLAFIGQILSIIVLIISILAIIAIIIGSIGILLCGEKCL